MWKSPSNGYDCVSFYDSLLSLFLHVEIFMLTCKSLTHCTQCDLAITRNTCISRSLLNYLDLFLWIKYVRLFSALGLWMHSLLSLMFEWLIMLLELLMYGWYCFYLICLLFILFLSWKFMFFCISIEAW